MNETWGILTAINAAGQHTGSSRWVGCVFLAVGLAFIAFGIVLRLKFKKIHIYQVNASNNLTISGESIIGDRKYQQDYFLFTSDTDDPAIKNTGLLAVICDGMGGLEGGEIASRVCAETIYNGFYQMGKTDNVCQVLKGLVAAADEEVSALKDKHGNKLRCGTTAIAVAVCGSKAYWVSTGDSRIYFYHNGRLEQITRDHNFKLLLQEQCNAGYITQQDVDSDKQKEALISYVGKGGDLIIDTGEFEFGSSQNDLILLCSDGLYKSLSADEIKNVAEENLDNILRLPFHLAKQAMAAGRPGRHDNITVLTLKR